MRANPAHFVAFGLVLVCFVAFLMCGWRGFGLFCSFMVHRPLLFLVYGVDFGQIFILARYLLSKKIKNLHADRCLFFAFWQKWLKVSSLKMAKKWFENLVMEIILFNTRFLKVPKIWLLRVVKKSALRLERVKLANF